MPDGLSEIRAAIERRSRRMPPPRRGPRASAANDVAQQDEPAARAIEEVVPHDKHRPIQAPLVDLEAEPTRQLTARLPLSLDDHLRDFEHAVRRHGLRDLTRQELVRHLVASLPTAGKELDGIVVALRDQRRR